MEVPKRMERPSRDEVPNSLTVAFAGAEDIFIGDGFTFGDDL